MYFVFVFYNILFSHIVSQGLWEDNPADTLFRGPKTKRVWQLLCNIHHPSRTSIFYCRSFDILLDSHIQSSLYLSHHTYLFSLVFNIKYHRPRSIWYHGQYLSTTPGGRCITASISVMMWLADTRILVSSCASMYYCFVRILCYIWSWK